MKTEREIKERYDALEKAIMGYGGSCLSDKDAIKVRAGMDTLLWVLGEKQ